MKFPNRTVEHCMKRRERAIICKLRGVSRLLLLVVVLTSPGFTQEPKTYIFSGEVENSDGSPAGDTYVCIVPRLGIYPVVGYRTKVDGRFSIRYRTAPNDDWYIYVVGRPVGWSLTNPPFDELTKHHKEFLGHPFKATAQGPMDLGVLPIQFWYQKAVIPLRTHGRHLSKAEWLMLAPSLLDFDGHSIGVESIGPEIDADYVDIENSNLEIYLPEGRWKLEFKMFDGAKMKFSKNSVGSTGFFTVTNDKPTTLVPVDIRLEDARF